MKLKYPLLLIGGILFGLTACNKGNLSSYPINGKWQETKLRLYGDSAGTITYDTTYTKPFTTSDYAQFNTDGTSEIASDHYYYPNTLNYPKTPQLIPVLVDTFKFTSIGASKYVLSQNVIFYNPGGFVVNDTVTVLTPNTLLLHSVFYSHAPGYYSVTDSYYQK